MLSKQKSVEELERSTSGIQSRSDMSRQSDDVAGSERRRQPKKVVEIEYQVASEIWRSGTSRKQSDGQLTNLPGAAGDGASLVDNPTSGGDHSVTPSSPPIEAGGVPFPASSEALYEEPWDLRAKRLKQEKEEQDKKRATLIVEDSEDKLLGPEVIKDELVTPKNVKTDINFARTVSQTSEADVYHDASCELYQGPLASTNENEPAPQMFSDPNVCMYEDAWDLKNFALEEKIRQMQMQSSVTYEEPWENSQKQNELQLRQMQFETGATYEDPWDSRQKQKELQKKFQKYQAQTVDEGGLSGCKHPPKESQTKALRRNSHTVDESGRECSQDGSPIHRSVSDVNHSPHRSAEGKHGKGKSHSHSMAEHKSKSSKPRGCNIGQRINSMIPLANQSWFHGNVSREDAEQMLCVCREGSYIVRISSDRKSYSLSIKSSKQNIHVQIDQVSLPDGTLHYILGKNSKEFCTIPEMIDYYTHHRVPLRGAEHITLLHPVECKWSQQ